MMVPVVVPHRVIENTLISCGKKASCSNTRLQQHHGNVSMLMMVLLSVVIDFMVHGGSGAVDAAVCTCSVLVWEPSLT